MKAYRLGSLAFVLKEASHKHVQIDTELDGEVLVKIELENFEAARKAVKDFNSDKHETLGYN